MKLYLFYFDFMSVTKEERMLSYILPFFDKRPNTSTPLEEQNPPRFMLYAITTSKKYKKIFQQSRDMTRFRHKEIMVNEDELEQYRIEYDHCFLAKQELRCRYLGKDGSRKVGHIVIPITNFEVETITYGSLDFLMEKLATIDSSLSHQVSRLIEYMNEGIFIEPVQDIIDTLGFDEIIAAERAFDPELWWDDYINIDELYVYMTIFGCTYRKGGLGVLCESGNFI